MTKSLDEPGEILFRKATIVTGEEDAVPHEADVLVSRGVIKAIGQDLTTQGARVIDAKGHWLTPGFIDLHAHSDLYLLTHPEHEAKISQGCTVSRHRRSPADLHRPKSSVRTVSAIIPSVMGRR